MRLTVYMSHVLLSAGSVHTGGQVQTHTVAMMTRYILHNSTELTMDSTCVELPIQEQTLSRPKVLPCKYTVS